MISKPSKGKGAWPDGRVRVQAACDLSCAWHRHVAVQCDSLVREVLSLGTSCLIFCFPWSFSLQKSVKTGVQKDRRPPGVLRETLSLGASCLLFVCPLVVFLKTSVKTVLQKDGRPPGALVLTQLTSRVKSVWGRRQIFTFCDLLFFVQT